MSEFKIGDAVVAIYETHGWGEVDEGDIGVVTKIKTESGRALYYVDFEAQKGWAGHVECFEPYTEVKLEETDQKVIDLLTKLDSIVARTNTYCFAYQGNGFSGYVEIKKGGYFREASCFSPICKNVCNMVVKPLKYNKPILKRDWEYLIKFIKSIHPKLNNIDKYGYSNKTSALYFHTNCGYLNYLAFCIYRNAINNRRMVTLLRYLSNLGYAPIEVYVIAMLYKDLWVTSSSKDILNSKCFYTRGLISRLNNVCRYKFKGAYTMEANVYQRRAYQTEEKGGTFLFKDVDKDKSFSEKLSKKYLDKILNYMEVGDEI